MDREPRRGTSFSSSRLQDILDGGEPEVPISFADLREAARAELSEAAFEYVAGGAGGESTVRSNRTAFERWRLVPRVLRDVSTRDLGVELLGDRYPSPLMLSPIGAQTIVHEEGEVAMARAAASLDVPMILSSAATRPIEAVAGAMDDAPRWFQLYWSDEDDLTASLVERAEQAGYGAIVVTVDTPLMGWRERDLQNAFFPPLEGHGLGNYFQDPVFREPLAEPPEEAFDPAFERFNEVFSDPTLTWEGLAFLEDVTDLPVLLKGVLHPADAERAVDAGIDGIVVSNHGGRQVDGAVGALEMLPRIRATVGDDLPLVFDSGIRRGSDVVKALGLGADAVSVGRPALYGLAIDGEDGVRAVLQNLLADTELHMALCGYVSPRDVSPADLLEDE